MNIIGTRKRFNLGLLTKVWFLNITNIKKKSPLDFEMKMKLRFVRIYFDATSFDKVVKDRADKPIDILSAIGGTMGLLTGFSIISGVEILYFAAKILINLAKKKIV